MSTLDQVIADTIHHVEHSADPDVHRAEVFFNDVIIPHLERVQTLMSDEATHRELVEAVVELKAHHSTAALSLNMVMREIRKNGLSGCVETCLGQRNPRGMKE